MENIMNIATQYKEVFSLEGKSDNYGFLVFCGIIFIFLLFLIVYLSCESAKIKTFVFSEMDRYGYLDNLSQSKKADLYSLKMPNKKQNSNKKTDKRSKRAPVKKKR
jgi:hypothetical protein